MNKNTKRSLAALGIVALGVLVYLIWIYLAPAPAVNLPLSGGPNDGANAPADVPSELVNDSIFKGLQKLTNLPIVPPKAGRAYPFEDYEMKPEPQQGTGEKAESGSAIAETPSR